MTKVWDFYEVEAVPLPLFHIGQGTAKLHPHPWNPTTEMANGYLDTVHYRKQYGGSLKT